MATLVPAQHNANANAWKGFRPMWPFISMLKNPRMIDLSGARVQLDDDAKSLLISTPEREFVLRFSEQESAAAFYRGLEGCIRAGKGYCDPLEEHLPTPERFITTDRAPADAPMRR